MNLPVSARQELTGAPGYAGVLLALLLLAACSRRASPSPTPTSRPQRALVLGGGGSTGRGWELGMLKGLYDAGIDLMRADLFVGTSAGSALNGQLLSGAKTIDELYDQYLLAYGPYTDAASGRYLPQLQNQYLLDTNKLWQSVPYTPAIGVQVGQRALHAPNAAPELAHISGWRAELGDLTAWPSQALKISAVDVSDGSVRLFDQTQAVPLLTAIAASTAIPGLFAPITVGDQRYMDGGIAGDHIDAAKGYPIIVAITPNRLAAPVGHASPFPGGQVLYLAPDAASAAARGNVSLDTSRVKPSMEAGLAEAASVASDVRTMWNG